MFSQISEILEMNPSEGIKFEVVPIFCFDPRTYNSSVTKYDSKKCGTHRAKFMIESVSDLRKNLASLEWDLLVYSEKPEVDKFNLIKSRYDLSRDNGPRIAKTFILF